MIKRSIFSKILTTDTPYLACQSKIFCTICEFKVLPISCVSNTPYLAWYNVLFMLISDLYQAFVYIVYYFAQYYVSKIVSKKPIRGNIWLSLRVMSTTARYNLINDFLLQQSQPQLNENFELSVSITIIRKRL